MTDNDNDNPQDILNRGSRLQHALAHLEQGSSARGAQVSGQVRQTSTTGNGLRYDSARDAFVTENGGVIPASAIGAEAAGPIPDDGRDIASTRQNYARELQDIEAKITRLRRFDPATGQAIPSAEVESLERYLARKREEVAEGNRELDRLVSQRVQGAKYAHAVALAEEDRAGRIANMAQEELEKLEAQERAKAIFASKRGGSY